jgi:hypothetical protein
MVSICSIGWDSFYSPTLRPVKLLLAGYVCWVCVYCRSPIQSSHALGGRAVLERIVRVCGSVTDSGVFA